jgi:hypothetical protein
VEYLEWAVVLWVEVLEVVLLGLVEDKMVVVV